MAIPEAELEGTWEEILTHASELEGRRLRVIVLRDEERQPTPEGGDIGDPMLALLDEWERTPLTPEELQILDDLETHLANLPFHLRQIGEPH